MKHHLGYNYFEQIKRSKQRKEKLKELGQLLLVIVIFLLAMAVGAGTYPY